METLHREKILQPVAPPQSVELLPGALRPHREWTATYLSVWVQAYNTHLVKREDLPKTFQDLLEPKWKGRLGMEAAVPEWYASIVMDMGEERGIRFFRELVARNGISMRSGHTLLNNLVIAGDVALALTLYQFMPEAAKRNGAPIDWFVLSTEAQQLLLSLDYIPTTGKLPSHLAERRMTLVDPALAMDRRDKWLKSFEDVLIRRASQ